MDTTHNAASLAAAGHGLQRSISEAAGRGVLAAVLTLAVAGCYTDKCVKMGYAEGTPENARWAHQLQTELTNQVNLMTQQLNTLSQTLAQQRQQKGKNSEDAKQDAPPVPAAAGFDGGSTIGEIQTPAISSMYDTWGAAALRGHGY